MKNCIKIAFFAALTLALIIFAMAFLLAFATFPPFSFFIKANVSAKAAIGYLRFPVCAASAALILASYQYRFKICRMLVPLILFCAAFLFGYDAFGFFDVTVAAYPFTSLILSLAPWLFVEIFKSFSKNKTTKTKRTAYFSSLAILLFLLAYLTILVNLSGTITASIMLLFALPVVPALTSLCILFSDKRTEKVALPIFVLIKLSVPAFFIYRCFDVLGAIGIIRYILVIFTLLAIFLLIYEIIFYIKTEREIKSMSNNVISGLGFHHIGLKVKDFERSYDFYVNGLGMKPYAAWGEGDKHIQMLDIGNGDILELFAGGSEELDRENVWQHFAMTVDDVDKAYETALKAGATPHVEPKVVALDSTPEKISINIAFVKGPDNEQLEFFKIVKE